MPDKKKRVRTEYPGIYLTPAGTYEYCYRENGKQRSKTFELLEGPGGAVEFKIKAERRQAEGQPVRRRKDAPTLEKFALDQLAAMAHLEDSTEEKYVGWLVTHVFPFLGDLRVHHSDLRPRRFAEWQQQRLDDGAGPAVLAKAQALVGRILKRAVLPHELLDQNPIIALPPPTWERREHRWLTAIEVESIREWYFAYNDIRSATLISCLGYVGLRPQAFLAREWTDLRDEPPKWVRNPQAGDGSLIVKTKNSGGKIKPGSKTSRTQKSVIYVPAAVMHDFGELRAATGGEGFIWARAKDGCPWTSTDYNNWRSRQPRKTKKGTWRQKCFQLAAEEVGLGPNLNPYALRHTAATLLASIGWDHHDVGRQLQHSSKVSLETYQHLFDEPPEPGIGTISDLILDARGKAPRRRRVDRRSGKLVVVGE
jgi:integrase